MLRRISSARGELLSLCMGSFIAGIRRIFSRSEAGLRKLGGVKVASLSKVTARASPFKPACAAAKDEEKSAQRESTRTVVSTSPRVAVSRSDPGQSSPNPKDGLPSS
ncbi:hypothetical protein AOLI_G00070630 [Acnodon oligacanthus]